MFAKIFRNTLVASSLLIGASLLAGPAALAQVSPGEAQGTITATSDLVFAPKTDTAIVNGAAVSYPMGTLTVQHDGASGWILEVSSATGGELVNTLTPTDVIAYTQLTTAAIGSSVAAPKDLAVLDTDYTLHTSAFDAAVADGVSNVAVSASIAAGQFVPAGIYADTLTFTLSAQ